MENNIDIIDIKNIECKLYNPSDLFLGIICNEYTMNDIRIQIAKNKLKGYYFVFNDVKIEINSDGTINNWIEGFYDLIEKQQIELFKNRADGK